MPGPLKNPRHEKFAQGLAEGKTADQAYQDAGYKPNRGNATTLKANKSVKDRVAELQGVTADEITDLKELARTFTREAIETTAMIMRNATAADGARLKAAENLLDRGWGKAPLVIEDAPETARTRNEIMDDIRKRLASLETAGVNVGPLVRNMTGDGRPDNLH